MEITRQDEGLSRDRRLTRRQDFEEAYEQGRRWTGSLMVMWLRSGADAGLRLGVVASRKVGGSVRRTRARRLLREAFRRQRAHLRGPVDVVLVARSALLQAPWLEINRELRDLARRAGILQREDSDSAGANG